MLYILKIIDLYYSIIKNNIYNNENIRLYCNKEKFYKDFFEYLKEEKNKENKNIFNIIDEKWNEKKDIKELIREMEEYMENRKIVEYEIKDEHVYTEVNIQNNLIEDYIKRGDLNTLYFYINYFKYNKIRNKTKKISYEDKEKFFELTYNMNWFDPILLLYKYLYIKIESE